MELVYDIELISQIVQVCVSANEELYSAREILSSIATHDEWTCKEKNIINENIRESIGTLNGILEKSDGLFHGLMQVKDIFEETGNRVSNSYERVDQIIGRSAAVVKPIATVIGSNIVGVDLNSIGWKDIWGTSHNELMDIVSDKTPFEAIPICAFPDFENLLK